MVSHLSMKLLLQLSILDFVNPVEKGNCFNKLQIISRNL